MNPKILDENPISSYDLKKELKKLKKRDEELSIRTGKTEEYVNQFTPLKQSDADALEKDLIALDIPRMKDRHVKKILDMLPQSPEEFKVIFQGQALTVTKENIQAIVSAVKKYL